MADIMEFPNTMKEFIESFSFKDSEEVYTNGAELIPVFRVEQGFEHYAKEIIAKAIDEFAEKICEKYTEEERNRNYRWYSAQIKQNIADIAEQLKGEQNERL